MTSRLSWLVADGQQVITSRSLSIAATRQVQRVFVFVYSALYVRFGHSVLVVQCVSQLVIVHQLMNHLLNTVHFIHRRVAGLNSVYVGDQRIRHDHPPCLVLLNPLLFPGLNDNQRAKNNDINWSINVYNVYNLLPTIWRYSIISWFINPIEYSCIKNQSYHSFLNDKAT